jgi:penicillin-binding protein 1A
MPRSRSPRRWRRRLALLSVPGVLVSALLLLVGSYLFAAIPLPDDIAASATRVLDRHGEEVGTLSPQATRQDVALDALPDHVPQAVLAAEDRGFFEHPGISYRGTARALVRNLIARDVEEGGSTITQQYIKNAALSPEQTFRRKANEAILAVKLEQRYEKEEILSFYLNTIYWGRGAYGIEAAAQTYFGVSATELDVNQAATLAGIIRAPERLDPADDPGAADIRRRYTLDGMARVGWLDRDEASTLSDAGLPEVADRTTVEYGPYAYYLDAVRRQLAAELGDEIVFRGLTVVTELDASMQRTAQRAVAERLADLPEHLAEQPVSGALASVDPEDGGAGSIQGAEQAAHDDRRRARQDFSRQSVQDLAREGRQRPAPAGFMGAAGGR